MLDPDASDDQRRSPIEVRATTSADLVRVESDARVLERLRRDVVAATARARAGVDVAEQSADHTARQLVYALSQGAAEDSDLRALLRELAIDCDRLSADAMKLFLRFRGIEREAEVAVPAGDIAVLSGILGPLHGLLDDGIALHAAAGMVRRRLPRVYGDPLHLDSEWPST